MVILQAIFLHIFCEVSAFAADYFSLQIQSIMFAVLFFKTNPQFGLFIGTLLLSFSFEKGAKYLPLLLPVMPNFILLLRDFSQNLLES